jgi:predicted nucleotidyltransferase
MRYTKVALKWIIDLMENNNIQYQVVGGLAAKAYGASRELVDIDLYVSGKDFLKVCDLAKEYITWGPSHFKNESWDLEYAKFEFKN